MNHHWQHYATAPVWLKILSWICLVSTGFVSFHSIMLWGDYQPENWVQEIYFNLLCGLPLFVFTIGSMIQNKKFRWPLLVFGGVFGGGYLLNIFNKWYELEISHLQWVGGISLLGWFVSYCIHLVKKNKKAYDIVHFIWFASISWSYIAQRFVPGGGKAGYFLLTSMILFPVIMVWGFIRFFKEPKA
jgi:hypothetical protein